MLNLIDKTYFYGGLFLPNLNESELEVAKLDKLITRLQEELLIKLLDYPLYKRFVTWYGNGTGLDTSSPYNGLLVGYEFEDSETGDNWRWAGLRNIDTLKSCIANYVYYHAQRDNVSQTVSAGEKKTNAQNAVNTTPGYKMETAWNTMVDALCGYDNYMDKFFEEDVFWQRQRGHCADIFHKVNMFNI